MDANILATWHKELDSARSELTRRGASASIRGEGSGVFLFVNHDGRAVEVFGDDAGGYIVEVWERGCHDIDHDVDVPGIAEAIAESRT